MSKLKKLAKRVTALEVMVDELHDLLKPQTPAPPAPPVDNAHVAPGCEQFAVGAREIPIAGASKVDERIVKAAVAKAVESVKVPA